MMTYNLQKIVVIISFLVIVLFNPGSLFGNPNNDVDYTDSIRVYQLIDETKNMNIDFEEVIQLSKQAYNISKHSNCKSCIAVAEFSVGIVFFNNSLVDSAIFYFNKAFNHYKKNNSPQIIKVINYLGYLYADKYDFKESTKFAKLGLAYADSMNLSSQKADFYLLIGSNCMDLGYNKKSTEALMSALTIFEKEKDSAGIISTLINLGLIFANEESYPEAFNNTFRALDISKKTNDNEGISICLNNIGYFYSSTAEYKKALNYFQQSLELDKAMDDNEGIAACLNNIGDSYKDLHDTTLAVSYYTKSLKLAKLHNYPVLTIALINLGEINLSWGNLKKALSFALKSVELAETQKSIDDILASYNLLYRCYAAMGNYEKAYNYSATYKQIYDSTYSIAKSKKIQEVISLYNDEQQKSEIVNLKEKSTNDFIFRVHLIQTIVIISLVLLVLFIVTFFIRRAKNIFRSQKRYYDKLLDRSEDFIFVVGKDGLTKYISLSYQRKFGRGSKDRIGKDSFEFIHPEDIANVKQEFATLVKDGKSRILEFRIKDEFDNWIDVHAYGQNLFNEPMIQGIVVNFWDITQRKKNEELIKKNETKFRQIFKAFPDIYFEADLNGIITEISPSVKKITGYTRDEIIGMNSEEFHHFIGDWRRIKAKFRIDSFINDLDTKITKKDKTSLYCSLSAEQTFTDNDKPIGIKGVIRDVSIRVANQKKLRDSEFKLKQANKSKEMLFSIISHDLIGPIGTNKSIVDMIVDQIDEFSHEEIVSLITSLKPSLDSTFSLIENLLSWSRIQQDRIKPNFDDISLNKLVSEMIQLLTGQAKLKHISLKLVDTKLITIYADKNQLDVALRNLVSNAIKFSNENNEIVISLEIIGTKAVIKIKDSGIGMSQKQIDDIITKGGSTTTIRGTNNEKGTGFGLIIVNEFIKNNHGKLNAISKVNEGTTFIIELPLKK